MLATSCEELTHWKRLWCWEGLGAGGEGDDRGWDGWMASLTWWMWVWVNSQSWWWTGRPGVLRFMRSQRVGHDWATELNWTELNSTKAGRILTFLGPEPTVQIEHFTHYAHTSLTPTCMTIPLVYLFRKLRKTRQAVCPGQVQDARSRSWLRNPGDKSPCKRPKG